MTALGRLRILRVDRIPDTRRCTMVLMVIEGTLEVGASIQYEPHYSRVLAMARPSYRRNQAEKVASEDLVDAAMEGETVEAIVDVSLYDSDYMDLLYHDFAFK